MIVYAIFAIVCYLLCFMGACSPTHLRILVSLFGLGVVGVAILAGQSLSYRLGFKHSDLNATVPFLMLGIGIDDMFVICNSIDQTSFMLSPAERLRIAMRHAGPSITMTSMTNILAFLAGTSSSIASFRGFCVHCSITTLILYVSVLTVFLPILYWDTIRVSKKRKDLCGLCFCKDDSRLFCKGKLLTKNQRAWSIPSANPGQTQLNGDNGMSTGSQTEAFLERYVTPCLFSTQGRIVATLVFVVITFVNVNGCMSIKQFWSNELSYIEGVPSYEYYQAKNKHFKFTMQPKTSI